MPRAPSQPQTSRSLRAACWGSHLRLVFKRLLAGHQARLTAHPVLQLPLGGVVVIGDLQGEGLVRPLGWREAPLLQTAAVPDDATA